MKKMFAKFIFVFSVDEEKLDGEEPEEVQEVARKDAWENGRSQV